MKLATAFLALALPGMAVSSPCLGGQFRTVYQFKGPGTGGSSGDDGAIASNGLLAVGRAFYGTTDSGGSDNGGTVFKLNPATGAESVVYGFGAAAGDGQAPAGSLIDVGGMLYGTTGDGGTGKCDTYGDPGCGTVFAVDPTTGAEHVVHSFQLGSGGSAPVSGLVKVGDKLYGTTLGSKKSPGTVFTLDPATGVESVIHAFAGGADGAHPTSLISVGGLLYGTTIDGGTGDNGTVFEVDPATGAERVVYAFKGAGDGEHPGGNLIYVSGKLFATTSQGGSAACMQGCGTVFAIDPDTGAETVVYAFQGQTDGTSPNSLISVAGALYGTTYGTGVDTSGPGNQGTLFKLNPNTGVERVLHAFTDHADGGNPEGGLIYYKGALYGTAAFGGTVNSMSSSCKFGCGTVFAYTP